MAGSAEDVQAVLESDSRLSELDEDVVAYLSGMVSEAGSSGEESAAVVELLTPFLDSYGVADAEEVAGALVGRMVECGAITLAGSAMASTSAAPQAPGTSAKLARPMQMSAGGGDDGWGLTAAQTQVNVNSMVDSISDALGNKKSLERQQKKADKDKRREEARFLKEEEDMLKAAEAEYATPVGDGKMTVSLRNRSRDVLIENVNISVGAGKSLLEDATLRIVDGRRYGMIGKNGSGKSTLFNHISRRQIAGFPNYLSVVHVEQEVVPDQTPVVDHLVKGDVEREALLKEETRLLALLELPAEQLAAALPEGEDVNELLRKLYDDMAAISADSAEARARAILAGLGFTSAMQDGPTKSLSGGWRMRVALARALYLAPDILLLDEPTNHLDILSVIWLERYLQSYTKTLIVISHDRNFTNNVITDVIHLDQRTLAYYKGDIDVYEQTRANSQLQQQREFESQQAKRAHMQKFVDKFRYNAKRASLAQSRIKALNRMTLVDAVAEDPEFRFSFPEPVSELNKVVEVQAVSFGFPVKGAAKGEPVPKDAMLFRNVDLSIFATSRIVILGANGCGKTTLVSLILDKLQPSEGYVLRDPKARIGFFAQHHVDQLNTRLSPLEYLLQTFEHSKPDQVRAHLSRYGVPAELANQRIGTMSGGQKSRVAFAKITWDKPHVIIMDEPSNHLDLETVAALCMAINMFEGGIVLVSHDQFLIQTCAEEFWVMHDAKLEQFKGSFDEYKKWVMPE